MGENQGKSNGDQQPSIAFIKNTLRVKLEQC